MHLGDLLGMNPGIAKPGRQPAKDPTMDSFRSTAGTFAAKTPVYGRGRSMTLAVSGSPCRAGEPCQHAHHEPHFVPDPSLDEIGVGWTTQHIPQRLNGHLVPTHCIFCWVETDGGGHDCVVLRALD